MRAIKGVIAQIDFLTHIREVFIIVEIYPRFNKFGIAPSGMAINL